MPKRSRLMLIGLVWAAAVFRLPSLFKNHFHSDEALFASWARLIAVGRDPLLLTQAVDKPPLLFYMQAIFYPLFGPEEWAARIPNYVASLLLVPLVALVAWHLYHQTAVSLLAALFVALYPLTIQFSATAFTDPVLSFFVVLCVLFAVYRPNPVLSGLFFGLAVATKYQAWLFLPLIIGLAWFNSWDRRKVRKWIIGAVPFLMGLVIWGCARSGVLSLWTRQVNNFGGIRLAWSWELLSRLEGWARLWHDSLGTSMATSLVLGGVVILFVRGLYRRDKPALYDLLLILFISAYMVLHWILAVPVWDRYLVPLFPFVMIILARTIVFVYRLIISGVSQSKVSKGRRRVVQFLLAAALLMLFILQLPAASKARDGRWPIGGQESADGGAWQVAALLADEPYGTVLYDHWYSWQWRYHLFDKGVYVSWFQHPQALVEDLAVFNSQNGRRYLVLPSTQTSLPVLRALANNGYQLAPLMETDSEPGMILYRIQVQGKNG